MTARGQLVDAVKACIAEGMTRPEVHAEVDRIVVQITADAARRVFGANNPQP